MPNDKFFIAESIAAYRIIDKILFEADGTERPLPFNIKYKLQRCRDIFSKDYKFFENERISLIKKYGTAEGDVMRVSDDKMQEFSTELKKISEIQVEHNIKKLKPEDVEAIEITDATTEEMDIFIALLVEDEELIADLKRPIIKDDEEIKESEESSIETT